MCRHTVNLADFNTFIIVTRPKVEFFPVSNKGQTIVSEVDSYVTLKIPANTFTNRGAITLEVFLSFYFIVTLDLSHTSHIIFRGVHIPGTFRLLPSGAWILRQCICVQLMISLCDLDTQMDHLHAINDFIM